MIVWVVCRSYIGPIASVFAAILHASPTKAAALIAPIRSFTQTASGNCPGLTWGPVDEASENDAPPVLFTPKTLGKRHKWPSRHLKYVFERHLLLVQECAAP